MKSLLTILKKEFKRFFTDKRMLITIFLPGILIYAIYSLMGGIVGNMTETNKDYKPTAYVINMPNSLSSVMEEAFSLQTDNISEENAKQLIADSELDIYIVFPQNFTTSLGSTPTPDVKMYYNSASTNSFTAYNLAMAFLNRINTSAFTINNALEKFDLAKSIDISSQILSIMVPMLMFALLASACISFAPESIAGEKERGTMATMLITPVKRSQIALGKIISLSCLALLSGISSFLGVIFALPNLMKGMISAEAAIMYNVGDYFLILAIVISVVLALISAFSVISALAKSVKEAAAFISPLMIVVILLGMGTMLLGSTPAVGYYLIPLLGSGLAMASIMSFSSSLLGIWLSIISNLVIAAGFVVLLTFMFKSERIMFKK